MKHISSFIILFLFTLTSSLAAQIKWTEHPDPVLSSGPAIACDEVAAAVPSVTFDDSTYNMWYYLYQKISPGGIEVTVSTNIKIPLIESF